MKTRQTTDCGEIEMFLDSQITISSEKVAMLEEKNQVFGQKNFKITLKWSRIFAHFEICNGQFPK